MKKHLVFLGIVTAISLFFSTANGLCEPYTGKTFPTDTIKMKCKKEGNTYLGNIKEGEGKFKIFFSTPGPGGRLFIGTVDVIHTDLNYWLYLAAAAEGEILQK